MSKRAEEVNRLMLHQFREVNGFLAAFHPEVREKGLRDEQIAAALGSAERVSPSNMFEQFDEFLKIDPYPFEIVSSYTNIYIKTPEKSKQWLQRMFDICRKAYEDE